MSKSTGPRRGPTINRSDTFNNAVRSLERIKGTKAAVDRIAHFDYVRVLAGDSNVYPQQSLVTLRDWEFTTGSMGGVGWAENRNTQLTFMNCRFRKFDNLKILTPVAAPQTFTYIENCCADNTVGEIRFVHGGFEQNFMDGGFVVNGILGECGGGVFIDFDTLMDGSSSLAGGGQVAMRGGGTTQIGSCGFMDWGAAVSGQAALISSDGGVIVLSSTASFYGSQGWAWGTTAGALSLGADIQDGGRIRVKAAANITLAATQPGADFRLGGALTGFPFDPVSHAYGAPIATTWANLAANGLLEDIRHDAKIYVSSGTSFPA